MSTPRFMALGTGLPPARYRQEDILEYFLSLRQGAQRRDRAIRTIFERAGVGFRHMTVGAEFYRQERTTQVRNAVYMAEAVPLGAEILRRELDAVGVAPEEIDHFIVVSCTGIHVPGLDLVLAGKLNMRPDLRRTAVLGMGCYGTFPGLKCAYEAVRGRPGQLALVLSLELCSLHLQLDDSSETAVSTALFADGAGVALVGSAEDKEDGNARGWPGPFIIGSATNCDYTTLDHMTFTLTDHGFRMYLSSYVPDFLSAQIRGFVDRLLGVHGLCRQQVRLWGIHPGSTKIIDYVQSELELSDGQVEVSHQILHDYGNMSSATILFVLERLIQCQQPQPGDYGVLLAFGPGLTMEGILLGW